jgi:transcriptional antiterminator RfaH
MGTESMRWYAVHAKPRQESTAARSLERLGIESFVPKLRQEKLIRRQRQSRIGPLFPGYLFARADLNAHYRAVNYAQGVRALVTFGGTPVVVGDEVIQKIRSKLHDGCVIVPPPSFRPGQAVRIQDGPLFGLHAVFERELSDHQRALLLLQALSYQARVVVDLQHVANW